MASGHAADLKLTVGMASNPRTWPLLDGKVKPEGIEFECEVVHGSELFYRQLKFAEFDVAEMSFSSLMIAIANGDDRFIGLPIFTTRHFFHAGMLARKDAGIDTPADLKGKRVGVPEYQQTAALWTRGVLQHEFGVAPTDMIFWMERTPELSHGGVTGFKPPPGVTVHQIPAESSLGEMVAKGELDATLLYLTDRNLVDRSRIDLHNHPDVKPLFPDRRAEGIRYYRKTGIYPINHGMVIKREVADKHPWAILSVFNAFRAANELCDAQRKAHVDYYVATGLADPEALAAPLVQHGIVANRKVLETAAQYSFEQGLTPRLMKLEDVFAPETIGY